MHELKRRAKFLRAILQDRDVAAVAASSQHVVRSVLGHLASTPQIVLECGPGDGVMTRAFLSNMALNGKLFAIETNSLFIDDLRRIDDVRLEIIEGRAQDAPIHIEEKGIEQVDLVLASIPFSFLTSSERNKFIQDAYTLLSPGGKLIIFCQYSPLMYKNVRKVFGDTSISFVFQNIPPCFVICGTK